MNSLPSLTKAAIQAARKWQGVPEDMTDEQAIGFLPPEVMEFLMQILVDMITNCLDNNQALAWRRVKTYNGNNRQGRIAENLLLNTAINRWLDRLGVPRERGDVVMVRESLVQAAAGVDEAEFKKIQTEVLFMGI